MDYSHMTVAELRKIAKEKGIAKAASLKKQELLDALAELETEEKKQNEDTEISDNKQDTDGETAEASGEDKEKSSDGQQGEQSQKKEGPGSFNRGDTKEGILEIMPDGFGFIRSENFLPGDADVYVSPQQIRKFGLRTGDIIVGITKQKTPTEKFNAMLYCKTVNGNHPYDSVRRPKFENLTPIFPHERLRLETPGCSPAMRIMDIL